MSGGYDIGSGGGASPLTTKGDLYTFSTVDARLPVGTNGQILSANSAQATGLEWITNTGGGATWSTVSTSGTINDLAITTNAIRFTGTSPQVRGIVPTGVDGQEIIIYNAAAAASNLTIISESATSTAANRFTLVNGTSIVVPQLQSIRLKYNATSLRWHVADINPVTATPPLSITAAGAMSIPNSTASVNGYLSAANFVIFNAKIGGSGTNEQIAYFTGAGTTIGSTSGFCFKSATQRMGVQQTTPLAAMHLVSAIQENIANPVSLTANLVQFNASTAPTTPTATQVVGRLMNPDTPVATENASGATGWSIGDTLDYTIYAVHDDGGGGLTRSAGATVFTQVVMAGNSNGVDLSWAADGSGSESITNYLLVRVYNGGAPEYLNLPDTPTTYTDDQSSFLDSDLTPYADYVASGTTRNYTAYAKDTIAGLGDYFSASGTAYNMTDDNSGKSYLVSHSMTITSTTARVIGSPDGTSNDSYIDDDVFTEESASWTADNTVVPTSYGDVSDGTVLTRDYLLFKTGLLSGIDIYSAGASASSTTDPNDANTYYTTLAWSVGTGGTGLKMLVDNDVDSNYDSGYTIVTGSANGTAYNTGSQFSEDTTVTPNGVAPNSFRVDKVGAGTVASHIMVQGTDDESRIDFVDSAVTAQAAIKSNTTEGQLNYSGDTAVKWNVANTDIINSLRITTLGKGLAVKTGSNAKIGQATLVAGTVTVSNSSVTTNSRIFLTVHSIGGTAGVITVGTITASTSFVINSSSATDTSVINWVILESIP